MPWARSRNCAHLTRNTCRWLKNHHPGRESIESFFTYHVEGELREEIKDYTCKGMAVASNRFKEELEDLTGRRLKTKKRERPIGWRQERV